MIERHLQLVFAESCRALRSELTENAVESLLFELDRVRQVVAPATWEDAVRDFCRNHPILDILLEDPYTRDAYFRRSEPSKDAVVFDWVLQPQCPASTTPVGRRIFACTTRRVGGVSVQQRCQRLAETITQVSRGRPGARIAMVGCGKLREADLLAADVWESIDRLLLIDQNPAHLGGARSRFPHHRIDVLYGNVDYLLRERPSLYPQDLITICGWCDYLDRDKARLLIEYLVASLRSGGQLLVTHLAPDSTGRGYMEAFMNWRRYYRDEQQLWELAVPPLEDRLRDVELTRDSSQNMVYLQARAR